MLNVTVPVVGMWLLIHATREQRSARWHGRLGLLLGLAALVYGGTLIVAGAMLVIMALDGERRRHIPRFAWWVLAPTVGWMLVVILLRGRFRSHEVAVYDQFVWLLHTDWTTVWTNSTAWLTTTMASIAVAAAISGLGIGLAWFRGWRPSSDSVRPAVVIIAVAVVFTWAMGFYQQRISWVVVMPLVVVAAMALSSVRLRAGEATVLGVVVAGWSLHQVLTPGPWT